MLLLNTCAAQPLSGLTFVSGTHKMTKIVIISTQPAKNRNVPHFIAHSIDRKDCKEEGWGEGQTHKTGTTSLSFGHMCVCSVQPIHLGVS